MNEIERITVIGSGIMGTGIAHSIFKYGLPVTLYDVDAQRTESSVELIKGKARRNMNTEFIRGETDLQAALKNCDLLIEAINEDLDLKCRVFKELGTVAEPKTIFATNTSALSISAMAEASGRADRFIGLHYFNPPLIMRLVEVISQKEIAPQTVEQVKNFLQKTKKQPVFCRESPGFIVNRILLPLINEAFYLLEDLIQSGLDEVQAAYTIDQSILENEILLIGPYNLADLTGLDTIYHVSNVIFEGFKKSPRYTKAPLLEEHFQSGDWGRKSGKGIYYYNNKENDPDINPCLNQIFKPPMALENINFNPFDFQAVIINEAYRVVEEKIVDNLDYIELAMELGTRWPKGPFRMAKEIGPSTFHKRLLTLYDKSGQAARYEPSKLWENPTEQMKTFFHKE